MTTKGSESVETIEQAYIQFVRAVEAEEAFISGAMSPSVHVISDGQLTPKTRNALLKALADLEQACAVFRWAAGNAALHARDATPGIDSDVNLLVHTRWQDAFDYIEGHAIAVIEVVARMRETGEKRDDVLDVRQHIKRLVDLSKSLALPRKLPKRRTQ